MPRKRMYNTVRTDMLESRIAFYEYYQRHDASEALRWLARSIAARISDERIEAVKEQMRQTDESWKKEPVNLSTTSLSEVVE